MPEDDQDEVNLSRIERARILREERRSRFESNINVTTLFDRLGYDLSNPEEITRLNENLRYAERQRRRYERMETSKVGWLVSFVLMVIGAAITTIVQWFSAKAH